MEGRKEGRKEDKGKRNKNGCIKGMLGKRSRKQMKVKKYNIGREGESRKREQVKGDRVKEKQQRERERDADKKRQDRKVSGIYRKRKKKSYTKSNFTQN